MQILLYTAITILCLFFLIKGSEWLLKGAVAIAEKANISKLAIASTLIAFGTNLPTLSVSLALIFIVPNGADTVIGNVLGTNYANLGLALGIPAFLLTIQTKYSVFEKEIPLYLAVTAVLTSFIVDRNINAFEGVILSLMYIFVTYLVYQYATKEKVQAKTEEELSVDTSTIDTVKTENISNMLSFGFIMLGSVAMIISSIVLAYITPMLSSLYGISEYVLGITLIGIGTSLPTVVTSIRAAKKNYVDIIFGNVFGGNIVNFTIGLGIPALFTTIPFNEEAAVDIYDFNLFNFLILGLILIEMRLLGSNKTLNKLSGLIMIAIFALYIGSKLV